MINYNMESNKDIVIENLVRIFKNYGFNKRGKMHFEFVGVDSKDQDIVDES